MADRIVRGDTGPRGLQGKVGDPGPRGLIGDRGPRGPEGQGGPSGLAGADGAGGGKTVKAMADANQVLTAGESAKGTIKITGALTAQRTLTIELPATVAESGVRTIDNRCTGFSVVVSGATGTSIEVEPGAVSIVEVTPTGVEIVAEGLLDPRKFGAKWDNVTDDYDALAAMIAAIPIQYRPVGIQVPKGQAYCSRDLHINRAVYFVGHGRSYVFADQRHNGIRFPCLRGLVLEPYFTSADNGSADYSEIKKLAVRSVQAIVSDEIGNQGSGYFFLSTTNDVWSQLPATVPLGSCVIRSGATVGGVADYLNDGGTRDLTHVVMFRCTTTGTKGSGEPAAFATKGLADIEDTITATAGTAVWTVESIPKDLRNNHDYLAGERVFVPGDNDHVFEAMTAGTSLGYDTTIAAASNGVALSGAGTISVASTADFPTAGQARVPTTTGYQVINYTGKTVGPDTLTGCTIGSLEPAGGYGTMATGGVVTQPFNYSRWGIGARIPVVMGAPPYLAQFYDRSTLVDPSMDGTVLSALATLTVYDGTTGTNDMNDFAASGSFFVWTSAGAYEEVTYTGKTPTTFTGCSSASASTIASSAPVGQGIKWKHIRASAITMLSNSTKIVECSIMGSTGVGVWITSNADPSVTKGAIPYSGGANMWRVRDCTFIDCGSALTINGFNCNGGVSAGFETYFLGTGRTDVDKPNYLNTQGYVAGVYGKFGNGACLVKDRCLGNNKHKDHYGQASGGMPFRNDLFGSAGPSGNFSVWDYAYAETVQKPWYLRHATVLGSPIEPNVDSDAVGIVGGISKNIRTTSVIQSDPTKTIIVDVGQVTGTAIVSPLQIQHSDDSYGVGFGLSDEIHAAYPTKWFTWGKARVAGAADAQAFLFPRPGAGATWPSGGSITQSSAANLPMWFNLDRIWLGALINVDPASIGFSAVQPATLFNVVGSVAFNRTGTGTLGWVCTATATPGTWRPMDTMATPPVVIAALAIDWSLSPVQTKTLAAGGNTITFANALDGQTIRVELTGATSTVTWPAAVKWAGGAAPTQTSAGIDVYTFTKIGASVYGSVVQAMA